MPLAIVPTINPGDLGASAYMNTYVRDNLNALIALVGSQNLLVNPGFEVYQRGTNVPASNLAFLVDRWLVSFGSGSSLFDSVETTAIDLNSAAALKLVYTHSAASLIDQKIEDYRGVQGKTISFGIRVRAGAVGSVRPYIQDSGAYTYGAATTVTGAYATITVTATISAAASAVSCGVQLLASDTLYLDNAVLAYGALVPAYVPLNPQVDLARCQRYYQVHKISSRFSNASTAAWHQYSFAFPVTMGGTPTATLSGDGTTLNVWAQALGATPSGANYAIQANIAAGSDISVQNRTATFEWNP